MFVHRVPARTQRSEARETVRRGLLAIYRAWERARQRRALACLSDALLRDIGLTRRQVERENAKSFWQP